MTDVIALDGFDHDGLRSRGEVFRVSAQVAAELIRAGLVEVHAPAKPKPKGKK